MTGLTAVFVTCGLILLPDRNHQAIGAEIAALALAGAVIFLFGFRQAFKFGSRLSKKRLVIGSVLYLAEVTGALVLMAGSISGLHVAAVAIVLNVAFMISAWLLVVSVYSARTGNQAYPTEHAAP